MYFTVGLRLSFGPKSGAKSEKPLPGACWDETCLSLLASRIFCESRNSMVVLFTCMRMHVCMYRHPFIIELGIIKENICFVHLLNY